MTDIKCLVEECKYNKSSNCHANEIEVRSSNTLQPSCADETACETFDMSSSSSSSSSAK